MTSTCVSLLRHLMEKSCLCLMFLVKENIAYVKSKYLIPGGDIAVDYGLIKKSDRWRVYDIIFDGISLMKNYRADFREHVSNNGIDSLITSLRE